MKKIAVITGASSGMGKCFAERIGEIGTYDEVWVMARRLERLEALELPFPVKPISLDLSCRESYEKYEEMLRTEQPEVALLINCSGFGKFSATMESDVATNLNMVDLNCNAVMALCQLTIPYMPKGSHILNIASVSAFQPVPYINVYAATKAFVLSFSRGLNRELRSLGIKVMAVCPFWTKTEFFGRAIEDDKEKVVKKYIAMYTPDQIVTRAIKDLKKGRDFSICGFKAKGQTLLVKLLPHKLVMNVWMKQQSLR